MPRASTFRTAWEATSAWTTRWARCVWSVCMIRRTVSIAMGALLASCLYTAWGGKWERANVAKGKSSGGSDIRGISNTRCVKSTVTSRPNDLSTPLLYVCYVSACACSVLHAGPTCPPLGGRASCGKRNEQPCPEAEKPLYLVYHALHRQQPPFVTATKASCVGCCARYCCTVRVAGGHVRSGQGQ